MNFSFLQKGTGKDVLFLHGYLSSKEAFTAQVNYFSRFYKVTAIDFLGFGKSPPLKEGFSVADYAKWLFEAMDSLALKKPHIIAHSFGCRVAVKLAATRPQKVDRIILTGAAGIRQPEGLGYKIKVAAYRACKKIAPEYAERRFGSKEYRTLSPVMKESYKKIVNEDLRQDAAKIPNRVLLVQGKADKTTPIEEARIYLQSFPNARLAMMDGGHFAFAENPLAFNLTVEEFLDNV